MRPRIAIAPGHANVPLVEKVERVRLVGVDAEGKLLDHGELDENVAVRGGHVTGLKEGKRALPADLSDTGARTFVLLVDASRPAKEVQVAVASLAALCWGFGVTVDDKLGVATTTPCPAGQPEPRPPDTMAHAYPSLFKTADGVTVRRLFDVSTLARGDELSEKLVAYRKESMSGGTCAETYTGKRPTANPTDDSGGTGTMMALEEGAMGPGRGPCYTVLAFSDSAKVGDVVELFLVAMAAGFTEPHWVTPNEFPNPTQPAE